MIVAVEVAICLTAGAIARRHLAAAQAECRNQSPEMGLTDDLGSPTVRASLGTTPEVASQILDQANGSTVHVGATSEAGQVFRMAAFQHGGRALNPFEASGVYSGVAEACYGGTVKCRSSWALMQPRRSPSPPAAQIARISR